MNPGFAGPLADADGATRSLIAVVDNSYSRMLLALEVVPDQTVATAERVLARLFEQYGTPRVLVTDNGRAFAPPREGYDHRFARFLPRHGVEHRRTLPYYPQTNGKAEAAAKTVKREFLGVLARRPVAVVGGRSSGVGLRRVVQLLPCPRGVGVRRAGVALRRGIAAKAGAVVGVRAQRGWVGGGREPATEDHDGDPDSKTGPDGVVSALPSPPLRHRLGHLMLVQRRQPYVAS